MGEDGTVQGCSVPANVVVCRRRRPAGAGAMDKAMAKEVLAAVGPARYWRPEYESPWPSRRTREELGRRAVKPANMDRPSA
jgi:hypothetical protein